MTKNMLIDAAHAEEVRVCVLENGKVEDFDFESSSRKPLRGNIYLARVTRVEPSLQAAFVEYGGNRHGFLAFNEIHPDYYQIPVSDRRLLQEAEAEEAALAAELDFDQRGDEDDAEFDAADKGSSAEEHDHSDAHAGMNESDADEHAASDEPDDEDAGDENANEDDKPDSGEDSEDQPNVSAAPLANSEAQISSDADADEDAGTRSDEEDSESEDDVAQPRPKAKSGRGDKRGEVLERYREAKRKRARLLRNYKIQEVIKRRQILLVQVVKEERGNKGAALTTYMSLAGRYCVLMPNTARGGGISRKIPVASDRKRLRRVVDSLEVPQGMGLIIRTAGAKRTKAEIKRDYDYLMRLWENIRSLTLKSIAPCLIYEEASLIKRAIRDLYDKDIDLVTVEGDAGYREAKDFMKMLMPSHAKNVQPFKDKTPLFLKYNVENQLDAMYQPTVRLKSGGYIVIHQTEALIAIDVNSGKSTRERNIELTALKTNIEAAKEASRQCRLRDLAGLIVIDFIDMEENKNNRTVEKKLKDAMKSDRARIQVGRISNFGLLEMSRQRRRSGIVDGTTHACPTCGGAGAVRSYEMAALRILRAIEGEAISARSAVIAVRASLDVTLYILNHKRDWLKRIEDDYALSVEIVADNAKAGDQYEVEKRGAPRDLPATPPVIRADQPEVAPEEAEPEAAIENEDSDEAEASSHDGENSGRKRRRRRRRRRDEDALQEEPQPEVSGHAEEDVAASSDSETEDGAPKKRRRRGRRGGRRNARRTEKAHSETDSGQSDEAVSTSFEHESEEASPKSQSESSGDDESNSDEGTSIPDSAAESEDILPSMADVDDDVRDFVNGRSEEAAEQSAYEEPTVDAAPEPEEADAAEDVAPRDAQSENKRGRKGWWQRAIGG